MRCPQCHNETEEGQAFCEVCAAPLTGYGEPVPGAATKETLQKLARLRIRPAAVPWMAAFMAAIAIFGPFGSLAGKFRAQPTVNAEGTNYMSSAFGAVGITLAAIFLVPLGAALLVAAWGVLTQRSWAWYVAILLLAVVALASLTAAVHPNFLKFVLLAVCIVIGWFWSRSQTREWYGV